MNFFKKIYYLFLPLFLGGITGLIISKNIDYTSLNQPPLAPPKIIFPIMWSILYLLMGIAFYIYKKNNYSEKDIDTTYYIQLFFNLLWPIIFFVLKLRFIAIIWILLLLFYIIKLLRKIKEVNKTSYYLLLPYLIWTIFATYLNIGIYILNR
ncbi:MAG: tryptophan-rich sensory protein [Bacilli bacterium]|nr:tryptophan-rich sensory protein [Bacilli bacterium]